MHNGHYDKFIITIMFTLLKRSHTFSSGFPHPKHGHFHWLVNKLHSSGFQQIPHSAVCTTPQIKSDLLQHSCSYWLPAFLEESSTSDFTELFQPRNATTSPRYGEPSTQQENNTDSHPHLKRYNNGNHPSDHTSRSKWGPEMQQARCLAHSRLSINGGVT